MHAFQDAIKVEQKAEADFEVPKCDEASLKKIREAVLTLAAARGGLNSAEGGSRK